MHAQNYVEGRKLVLFSQLQRTVFQLLDANAVTFAVTCQCGKKNCLRHLYEPSKSVTQPHSSKQRNVSKESKKLLAEKHESYRFFLLPADFENVKPVSFPKVFLEFGHSQSQKIAMSCSVL